jgi:hypothetical protein
VTGRVTAVIKESAETGIGVGAVSQDWREFYEYENSGTGDAWVERMMFGVAANGLYEFCIVSPPVDEDDTAYTEWESDEPAAPQQVLEQIMDAIRSRGLRTEYAIEAAVKLLDHLPTNDANVVCRSISTALASDHELRLTTKALPSGIRRQIQRIMRKY